MPVKIPHAFVEIRAITTAITMFQSTKPAQSFRCLFYATSSQVMKPLDKTSFQFHNLFHQFHSMKTCAMNTNSSKIQKFPEIFAI